MPIGRLFAYNKVCVFRSLTQSPWDSHHNTDQDKMVPGLTFEKWTVVAPCDTQIIAISLLFSQIIIYFMQGNVFADFKHSKHVFKGKSKNIYESSLADIWSLIWNLEINFISMS